MAVHVPIKDINSPMHLGIFVTPVTVLEVYTGWVGVNFSVGGRSVSREEYVSFVPLSALTIRRYGKNDLLAATVTAALSAVATVEDEANVAAVDSASVGLEPQRGVGGIGHCLVLRAKLAALHATVHGIAYQVTVLARGKEGEMGEPPQQLPPDFSPQ